MTQGRLPARPAAQPAAQARPVARPGGVAPAQPQRPAFRPAASPPAAVGTAPAAQPRSGWLKRGAAIVQGYEHEHAKQEERAARRASGADNVWRFFLGVNESAEIVILDKSFDDFVAFHEHVIPNAQGGFGKGSTNELCPKEFELCPLCDKYKESYYLTAGTCLDLRGYTKKDDQNRVVDEVPFVRRLLPIKTQSLPAFMQVFNFAMEQYGTTRGLYMKLVRPNDKNSPGIGAPSMLSTGMLFAMYSEEDLIANFSHAAIIGRDGKTVLKEANSDLQPLDYDVIFPAPSADDLRKRYNIPAVVGNARAAVDQWADDQIPMQHDAQGQPVAPAPGMRSRPAAPAGVARPAGVAAPVARPAAAPAVARPAGVMAPRAAAPIARPVATAQPAARPPVARPAAVPPARPAAAPRPAAAAPAVRQPVGPAARPAPARPFTPNAAAPVATPAARARPRPAPVAPAAEQDAFGGDQQ